MYNVSKHNLGFLGWNLFKNTKYTFKFLFGTINIDGYGVLSDFAKMTEFFLNSKWVLKGIKRNSVN